MEKDWKDQNSLKQRLESLTEAEKNLDEALTAAYTLMSELSKDRLPTVKQLDNQRQKFTKAIGEVEKEVMRQIELQSQVAVGFSHEGSVSLPTHQKLLAVQRRDAYAFPSGNPPNPNDTASQ